MDVNESEELIATCDTSYNPCILIWCPFSLLTKYKLQT